VTTYKFSRIYTEVTELQIGQQVKNWVISDESQRDAVSVYMGTRSD